MCDLKDDQIKAVYHDITFLWETESVNSAQRILGFGGRLLCISCNPPEADRAAVYILGWPGEKGEIPLEIQRYGI